MLAKFATEEIDKLTETIEIRVLSAIKEAPRGTIFFVECFLSAGNSKAVNKALERLVAKQYTTSYIMQYKINLLSLFSVTKNRNPDETIIH